MTTLAQQLAGNPQQQQRIQPPPLTSTNPRSPVNVAKTGSPRKTTGGKPYGGMELIIRQPRKFAVGERSANFDTLFGHYIDAVRDPSRARLKDPDVQNRMRQDLQILGCLNVRKLATAQLKRQWVPADQTPAAAEVAKRFERWFDQQYRVTEMLLNLLDAILDGIAIQEMVWELNEDDYSFGLDRLFPCYKDRFVFSKDGKLCLLTRSNVFYGEQVHPWQFIQHVYGATGGSWSSPTDEARLYWGRGLEDNIYPNFFFKTVVLNLSTRWLQRLSGGVFVGRYPFKNPEARAIMETLMQAWQEDETFCLPSGEEWAYDIHEGTKAPADTYLSFIEYFDKQMAKVILGATLINDQTDVGSHALGEIMHRTTFGRIVEFDRVGAEESINRSIVPVMGMINHVPKPLWPSLRFCLDPANHGGEILDDFTKLQSLGFEVSAEMVSETTGYRTPRPGETVLQAKADMMGGFDLMGMGQRNGPRSSLSSMDLSTPQGLNRFRMLLHRSSSHSRGMMKYQMAASADGHTHNAQLDRDGNGETDAGPDGHKHSVRGFVVQPDDKQRHTHSLMMPADKFTQILAALTAA